MNLLDEQMLSLDEYNRYVMKHPEELQLLFNDLLIGVTHFFRDKESFDTLRKHFVPAIVENNIKKGENPAVSGSQAVRRVKKPILSPWCFVKKLKT